MAPTVEKAVARILERGGVAVMEKCPKCHKYYLMYDPQIRTAVCANQGCNFEDKEELRHFDYVIKYACPLQPEVPKLKAIYIRGLGTSHA